jgi:coenzyme F420-reducing hydrogenase gamma subunit
MNKIKGIIGVGLASIILSGCGGNKLDVADYETTKLDRAKAYIPDVCRDSYKNAIPRVAVVNFTNNSTFGKAEIKNTRSKSSKVGAVGIGISPVGIGAVAASKSKSSSNSIKRKVDAKISKSVTDVVETTIAQMGGARIYSRTDLEKILKEQKFQSSGLADDSTLVELGKMAGVKYIITGAINNVKQKYVEKVDTLDNSDSSSDKRMKQLKTLANIAILAKNALTSGMTVETDMSIKILDVQSGEIVMSKNLNAKVNIGDIPNPSFDQIVGGLKEASKKALQSAKAELSKYFKVRGYIIKLKSKGNDRVALLNVGENMKIKEGQEFFVYNFEEVEDPMSGKKSCDMTKTNVILKATNQITKNKTWATSSGKTKSLRLNQLVERKPIEGKKSLF